MYLDFNTLRCGRSSLVLSVCLNVDVDALYLEIGSGHNDSLELPVSKLLLKCRRCSECELFTCIIYDWNYCLDMYVVTKVDRLGV